jgi:hypothetical protein
MEMPDAYRIIFRKLLPGAAAITGLIMQTRR